MKKIFIIIVAFAPLLALAQEKKLSAKQQKKAEHREKINQMMKQEEEGALIFLKQSAFGIKLNTDGYGIFYEHGKYKTITKTNLWWLELGEHKHEKEAKVAKGDNSGFITSNPFVYGKVNNFYNFKIGLGQQRLIGGKGNKNGVATSFIYGGGLSLALLKPYYLEVEDPVTGKISDIKYSDNNTLFLDPSAIRGASGFGKGFKNMTYVTGAYIRTSLRFDYGHYNEVLRALEVGLNVEFYSKKIEQMALSKQKQMFINAYVALVFGKRK